MKTQRSHVVKLAAIGGEQDSGFEQSFSSLGYAYLADKAPRLLDYIVGFQLVDRNDDNTKAIGVFGFKIGKQWLYAPVFFLNGDLKGHELLYIKDQDMFVPLKENWINYVMSRKPHILGEGSKKDVFQLGGLAPNIERLSYPPPRSKYGSDLMAEWAKPFLPALAALMTKKANFLYREAPKDRELALTKVAAAPMTAALQGVTPDLVELMSSNFVAVKTAWELCQKYPIIKTAFEKFHGHDVFLRAGNCVKAAAEQTADSIIPVQVKQASHKPAFTLSIVPALSKQAAADEKPKVKIITDDDVAIKENLPELTGEEKQTIARNGYLVKDERAGDEVSVAYNTQVQQVLSNPHESGVYNVLEAPGEFSQMLVFMHPYTNAGQRRFATVVRKDGGEKSWLNAHPTTVFAKKVELPEEDYAEWFKGVGNASLEKDGVYMAVSETGQATTPFRVDETYDGGRYRVTFRDYEESSRNTDLPRTLTDDWKYCSNEPSSYNALLVKNARKDAKLRAIAGELHVPDTFKFVKLKSPPKPKKVDSNSIIPEPADCCGECGSDPKPIVPGSLKDIQTLFTTKTAAIKLYGDNNEVTIRTEKRGYERMSWRSALFNLVTQHGLREKQAEEMLKTAQIKQGAKFQIKYADDYPLPGPGPSSPTFPGAQYGTEQMGYNAVNAIYPQEDFLPVPGLDSSRTDPRIYDPFLNMNPDPKAVATAQQAAQQGQKEVFDTTMVAGLLKAVRPENQVDKYLGDLMKAEDRLGRMLMLFYWHQEDFTDRYGKNSLPELEDSLRNSFETLGDMVLFLKEKTVEPGIDEISDPNIEDVSRN